MSAFASDGYFLSGSQKNELLLRGQMHDEQQRLYDIWIVPGYVVPGRNVREGWLKAGDALAEYKKPIFYKDISTCSHDAWNFGSKNILREFAFRGTRQAWNSDMDLAGRRAKQRVFGWWLAYPWGVLEATTESVVRVVGGVPVGLSVTASAYTLVPIGYGVMPLIKSTGYAAIEGTAWPLSAAVWNTAVAPPLAVFGQRPAPERADGFWMKQIDDPRIAGVADVFADWRSRFELTGATRQRDDEIVRIENGRNEKLQVLNGQIKQLNVQAEAQEQEARQHWLELFLTDITLNRTQLEQTLQAKGVSMPLLVSQRPAVEAAMVKRDWRKEDASRLLDALLGGRFRDVPQMPVRDTDEKTDPVKRVLQVIDKP